MGQTSKTLLTALIISLFSLSAVQGLKIVNQNSMSKVLGDTTIPSPPSVQQGVPCSLINTWQQRFCSGAPIPTNYPTPQPTRYPLPTPITCQPSATQVSNVICKYNSNLLHSAKYQCQDKTYVTVGDVSNVNCFDKQALYEQAYSRCKSICNTPPPMPTPYTTPTSVRYPTATPTRAQYPTSTPAPLPDLLITDAILTEQPLKAGYFNYLVVTIHNQGMVPSKIASNVYATLTDSLGRTTSCEASFGPIQYNSRETASLQCIAYNPGPVKVVLQVDANNTIKESNESNNGYTLNLTATQ